MLGESLYILILKDKLIGGFMHDKSPFINK